MPPLIQVYTTYMTSLQRSQIHICYLRHLGIGSAGQHPAFLIIVGSVYTAVLELHLKLVVKLVQVSWGSAKFGFNLLQGHLLRVASPSLVFTTNMASLWRSQIHTCDLRHLGIGSTGQLPVSLIIVGSVCAAVPRLHWSHC